MKAVLCKEYGPPEKLVYEDTTRPDVGPTDVRIRVRAAGVNFPDLLIIENKYQFKPPLPFAPGGEGLVWHGATGGVGSSAVEVGKNLGARIVATGGDDRKLARLAELYGVEHLVNYRTNPDWKETVKAITDGGADVIYDPVGGDV